MHNTAQNILFTPEHLQGSSNNKKWSGWRAEKKNSKENWKAKKNGTLPLIIIRVRHNKYNDGCSAHRDRECTERVNCVYEQLGRLRLRMRMRKCMGLSKLAKIVGWNSAILPAIFTTPNTTIRQAEKCALESNRRDDFLIKINKSQNDPNTHSNQIRRSESSHVVYVSSSSNEPRIKFGRMEEKVVHNRTTTGYCGING